MSKIIVQKYGGSSLHDTRAILAVAERISASHSDEISIVAVVSAMGSTTDELTNLASQLNKTPDRRELDLLLSTGELVSCTLTTMALQAIGKPSKSLSGWQAGIYTDNRYGRAQIKDIDISPIMNELNVGNIVIIAGFQGIEDGSDITTLGRGGSDTTAVAIAAALNAERCEIYTDVEGIYSADPRLVPYAKKLNHISYEEMLEMASYGAKMHPRSIELAMTYNVPIYVASSFNYNEGTLIHTDLFSKMPPINEHRKKVTSIATTHGYTKFTLTQVPNRAGLASQIFEPLSEKDISVDEISMNAERGNTTDLTFTVDSVDRDKTNDVLEQLKTTLDAGGVIISDNLAKISVIGTGMREESGYAALMFTTLASKGINIDLITTSEIRITCLIDAADLEAGAKSLHEAFELD
ncbi:MAG: aspartate kinase [SAR202 cluster bacterium]|nr:aspartate kinase [SAR202 cluster bacterium]|tara:strand:+ start:1160 stop:2389 length:1230 start_codon:yes stop_codon:yes gene_type:complete